MLVGRAAGALGFPQRFGQRFQHGVLGGVGVAEALASDWWIWAMPGGAVGGYLLADGEVQSHVEERVLAAASGV